MLMLQKDKGERTKRKCPKNNRVIADHKKSMACY
jgi:ribosomal protein S27AE